MFEYFLIENVMGVAASREDVEVRFVELRESPILVFGILIDCNEDSITTMRQTHKYFDEQPLLDDVFEMRDGAKCVLWRLADNSKQALTKTELGAFLDETEKQKALRTAQLYAKKRQLKDNGGTYAQVLVDWLSA